MKTTLLTALLLISTFILQAQDTLKKHTEIEKQIECKLNNGHVNENIIEFGENGIILYYQDIRASRGKKIWTYLIYNNDLEVKKEIEINVPLEFKINKTWHNNNTLITLFLNPKGDYILSNIDIITLKENNIHGEFHKKADINSMSALGDYAYFNISIKDNKFLYSINCKTGDLNVFPITIKEYKNKYILFESFQLMENSQEIFIYIQAKKDEESKNYILQLDNKGIRKDLINLTNDKEKILSNVTAQKNGENKYIYTGTYLLKNGDSEGMFFCETKGSKVLFIKYYKFSELKNFFNYLPEISKKKTRKSKNTKDKTLKNKYTLSAHKIKVLEDGYIYLAEAYYSTDIYTSTYYSFHLGKAFKSKPEKIFKFDGYQYTHAVLLKFDKKGNLVWDRNFKMWKPNKPYTIKKFITVNDNKLNYVFTDEYNIVNKAFDKNGIIITESKTKSFKTDINNDTNKLIYFDIEYWYNNFFISSGTQNILIKKDPKSLNNKRAKNPKQNIHFINKIKQQK